MKIPTSVSVCVTNLISGRALSNKFFTMMKALSNPKKKSVCLWPKKDFKCQVNKMRENSPFLFFHAMSELSELFTLKTLSLPMQFYI